MQQMKAERDLFAENMKKAFMRGVCALNLEAMTMFHSGGGSSEGGRAEEAVGHTSDSSSTDSGPGTGNPPLTSRCCGIPLGGSIFISYKPSQQPLIISH